jgi:predicted PurR-regulated permease PerM
VAGACFERAASEQICELRAKSRFLRLVGHSHVATTTLAVDEAGFQLGRFLLMQLVVNSIYALVIGIGLLLIGIPNALLRAVCCSQRL